MSYFREDNGNKSMTRLLVFMAAVCSYFISLVCVMAQVYLTVMHQDVELPWVNIISLVTVLLGYAGIKKVVQKGIENK